MLDRFLRHLDSGSGLAEPNQHDGELIKGVDQPGSVRGRVVAREPPGQVDSALCGDPRLLVVSTIAAQNVGEVVQVEHEGRQVMVWFLLGKAFTKRNRFRKGGQTVVVSVICAEQATADGQSIGEKAVVPRLFL